jgi:5-formyltetrahydrofolate cyclo-ligase
MEITEQKWELRREVKQWRRQISDEVYQSACTSILKRVVKHPHVKQAKVVHCYVSMNDRREIDTRKLIRHLLEHEKTVVVPRMLPESQLAHYQIKGLDELVVNDWGIAEPDPKRHSEVDPQELDTVLVPLSAADLNCHRLGYGKGFYDRFLSQIKAHTLGLCYDEWLVESLPTDEYDIPLDMVLTEDRIHQCS